MSRVSKHIGAERMERVEETAWLKADGMSHSEIAEWFDCSYETVKDYVRDAKRLGITAT